MDFGDLRRLKVSLGPISRFLMALVLGLFLVACEATTIGAVSISGVPAKIEIKENSPDGIIVYGMDVTINSEFMGTAKRIGKLPRTVMNAQVAFEPIKSKYGEIKIIQNINSSIAHVSVSFDVYVAGAFAGNVQMAKAF